MATLTDASPEVRFCRGFTLLSPFVPPRASVANTDDEEVTEDEPNDAGTPNRFLSELRDAVTRRSAALVLGVLILQFGFIASYLGAFHNPVPNRIPIAVVAPAGAPAGTAEQVAARLNALPGRPVEARTASSSAAGRALLDNRTVYGVIDLAASGPDTLLVTSAAGAAVSTAVETVVTRADQAQQRTVTVVDAIPAGRGDARGLSAFYLAVGWVVGGYLVAAILGIAGGARPANRVRAVIRLGALAAYAIVSGFGGALITETILSALSGHFAALWVFGTLLVFAVGAFTMALQTLLGTVGIGVAIGLFVVLGNPSAGGAYPAVLLPPFWSAIGPWLPPGAATDAIRRIVYFPSASIATSVWVLVGYAIFGLLTTIGVVTMRSERTTSPALRAA